MNAEPPAVPDSFTKKLRKFDPDLGLEWVGNHWVIVDTTKVMARYPRDRGGLIIKDDYITIHDRLFHLEEGRQLDGSVIEGLRYRDTYRFGDKRNFEQRMNTLAGQAEIDRKKDEQSFRDATVSELKTLKRFGVTVPGRRDEIKGRKN